MVYLWRSSSVCNPNAHCYTMNDLLFDKIRFYSLTRNILWTACVVNSVSFHFLRHIRGKYTHRTWLFQSCNTTKPDGSFRGTYWLKETDLKTTSHDIIVHQWFSLTDCLLTQWPLIVLKSSWVDSQWAEVNGNRSSSCVARPTHVVSSSVKRVVRYWSFIPERETHITHCIVW